MRGLQPVVSAASLIVSASTGGQCSATLTQLCQGFEAEHATERVPQLGAPALVELALRDHRREQVTGLAAAVAAAPALALVHALVGVTECLGGVRRVGGDGDGA